MIQALLILKPDAFDSQLRIHPHDRLKKDTEFPNTSDLLNELLAGSVACISAVAEKKWTEKDIRLLYNEDHHLIPELDYHQSRVDRLVELFSGKSIKVFQLVGEDDFIPELRVRMKEIRSKYLQSPTIAFCSIFHLSDSAVTGDREIQLYF